MHGAFCANREPSSVAYNYRVYLNDPWPFAFSSSGTCRLVFISFRDQFAPTIAFTVKRTRWKR